MMLEEKGRLRRFLAWLRLKPSYVAWDGCDIVFVCYVALVLPIVAALIVGGLVAFIHDFFFVP